MATAESCTGGMIAASCTHLSGSSAWFERGFVTYANEAKTEMLGVPATLIAQHGAVSEPVARAMAFGAVRHSRALAATPARSLVMGAWVAVIGVGAAALLGSGTGLLRSRVQPTPTAMPTRMTTMLTMITATAISRTRARW